MTVLTCSRVSLGFGLRNGRVAVLAELVAPTPPEPPEGRDSPWVSAARMSAAALFAELRADCDMARPPIG